MKKFIVVFILCSCNQTPSEPIEEFDLKEVLDKHDVSMRHQARQLFSIGYKLGVLHGLQKGYWDENKFIADSLKYCK